MTTFERIASALKNAHNILLCGHENPDGDCVGSIAALAGGLRALGKHADIFLTDVPPALACLVPSAIIELTGNHDLIVALDCASEERLALKANIDIAIDHHAPHSAYAKISWVEESESACGMMVLRLLDELAIDITPAIADALFVSICSDTGGFSNSNTNAAVFAAASRLTEAGANILWKKSLFDSRSPASTHMLGAMLSRYTLHDNGRIAAGFITHEEAVNAGAVPGDHEGLVDALRNIQGVETAIFVRGKAGSGSKVSMRTTVIDAGKFMAQYKGGGHPRAAGCDLPLSPEDATKLLIADFMRG
ncbi:MAG: bifunctional oligoribonuclease/PAP phosphatase NrnA [Clostridia bacterium]|nr:bifunctional oligoribonuclease/PAP phosphatase NrnA [Clostridia bacterium]